MAEAEVAAVGLLALKGPEAKKCWWKSEKADCFPQPPEGTRPADTLILA